MSKTISHALILICTITALITPSYGCCFIGDTLVRDNNIILKAGLLVNSNPSLGTLPYQIECDYLRGDQSGVELAGGGLSFAANPNGSSKYGIGVLGSVFGIGLGLRLNHSLLQNVSFNSWAAELTLPFELFASHLHLKNRPTGGEFSLAPFIALGIETYDHTLGTNFYFRADLLNFTKSFGNHNGFAP